MMSGLAGACLSLAETPMWMEGLSAGRGWIALALVVFGAWRPWRVLAGAYLFGGIAVLQLVSAGLGLRCRADAGAGDDSVSGDHRCSVGHVHRRRRARRLQAPACLGKPFDVAKIRVYRCQYCSAATCLPPPAPWPWVRGRRACCGAIKNRVRLYRTGCRQGIYLSPRTRAAGGGGAFRRGGGHALCGERGRRAPTASACCGNSRATASGLIFSTSFGFMNSVVRVAKQFPGRALRTGDRV